MTAPVWEVPQFECAPVCEFLLYHSESAESRFWDDYEILMNFVYYSIFVAVKVRFD